MEIIETLLIVPFILSKTVDSNENETLDNAHTRGSAISGPLRSSLVRVSSNTLLVFDSLIQHAPRAAMDNLNRFVETLKLSHERYHRLQVTYVDCVQQAPGNNDCSLHVVNNLYTGGCTKIWGGGQNSYNSPNFGK